LKANAAFHRFQAMPSGSVFIGSRFKTEFSHQILQRVMFALFRFLSCLYLYDSDTASTANRDISNIRKTTWLFRNLFFKKVFLVSVEQGTQDPEMQYSTSLIEVQDYFFLKLIQLFQEIVANPIEDESTEKLYAQTALQCIFAEVISAFFNAGFNLIGMSSFVDIGRVLEANPERKEIIMESINSAFSNVRKAIYCFRVNGSPLPAFAFREQAVVDVAQQKEERIKYFRNTISNFKRAFENPLFREKLMLPIMRLLRPETLFRSTNSISSTVSLKTNNVTNALSQIPLHVRPGAYLVKTVRCYESANGVAILSEIDYDYTLSEVANDATLNQYLDLFFSAELVTTNNKVIMELYIQRAFGFVGLCQRN